MLHSMLQQAMGFALWLSISFAALAGPVDCGTKPIRLAFYEYGSFYFEEKGQVKGIDKDFVEEIARRSGCRFHTQVMTRARIWADLASGDLDVGVAGIQNAERDKFAWFANYLTMKNYAIVQADVAANIKRADDFLANKTLHFGVVRAFKHGVDQDHFLDRMRATGRVQESPDVETIFKKLKEGRVNGMFSQPPVFRKQLADLGMEKSVMVQDWTPGEKGVPHGLILAKTRFSEKDAEQWRALIETMRQDGTLKGIYSRYLPDDEAARMLDY